MDFTRLFLEKRAERNLQENTLYKDAAEKAALLASKDRIAEAFVYNFLGMLGLINATNDAQRALLKTHFMNDKKVRIDNIDDTNHDISLVVKLAKDAGFFKNDTVVNNITRFLAKLKAGQIDQVNSELVAGWLDDMKPEFYSDIRDTQTKKHVLEFKADGGKTIDISRVAIRLKARVNKVDHGGEYKAFAKTFGQLKEKDIVVPAAVTTAVPNTISVPIAPSYMAPQPVVNKRTRRTKAQMQAARAGSIIASVAPTPVAVPTPVAIPVFQQKKVTDKLDNRITYISYLFNYIFEDNVTVAKRDLSYKLKSGYSYTDDELDYIETNFAIFKRNIIETFYLNVSNFNHHVDDAIDKLKNAKILEDNLLEAKDFFVALRNYYDYPTNRDKFPSASFLSFLYYYPSSYAYDELSPIVRDNSRMFENLKLLYQSNIVNRKQIINDIFENSISYSNTIDNYVSFSPSTLSSIDTNDTGMGICLFILKVILSNNSLSDVISIMSTKGNISSTYINIKNIVVNFESMISYNFLGYNVKMAFKNFLLDLKPLEISRDFLVKVILRSCEFNYNRKLEGDIQDKFMEILSFFYKDDIEKNGLENSQLLEDSYGENYLILIMKALDIALSDLTAKFPNDKKLLQIRIDENGIDSVSDEELVSYVQYRAFSDYKSYYTNGGTSLDDYKKLPQHARSTASEFADIFRKNSNSGDKIARSLAILISQDPVSFDQPDVFSSVMKMIPNMNSAAVVNLVRIAKLHGLKRFFDPDIYKNTSRRADKDTFKSIISGVMHDCIGTDVEDYFSDILEEMPGGVIDAIRKNLVGMNALVQEVEKGQIQPYGTIDDKRLKQMLAMNDIDVGSLISSSTTRKKKNEKWTEYFKRAKADISTKKDMTFLGKEKVSLDKTANVKKMSKFFNQNYHAGNHGNIYAKILKSYDASIKFPEFDDFRKRNYGDGSITPAFHGTGGIAATMILRYGFKVIKSTDASVVGRMLGDGIYFSNKLDKALQYVSNSGYGRDHGSKGYIFQLDTNLGQRTTSKTQPDYMAMGLGGDNIRSPEWCVRDPKAQTAIIKVYEVELASRYDLDQYTLNESKDSLLGFREFIKENVQLKQNNIASFTFRDGLIPILDRKENMIFVDFEDAIRDNQIPKKMIDYSRQGPVVVFENSDKQESFDLRFAETMTGQAYKSYVRNFRKVFFS